jgi:hypothetical protein
VKEVVNRLREGLGTVLHGHFGAIGNGFDQRRRKLLNVVIVEVLVAATFGADFTLGFLTIGSLTLGFLTLGFLTIGYLTIGFLTL